MMENRKNVFTVFKRILQQPSLYLILASLILLLRILEYNSADILMDDAFISFRYAKNLASGLGLVFNPGERVEGYTNFLWVVMLAICQNLGLGVVTASKLLAGISTFGTLFILYLLSRRLFYGYPHKFIFVAFPLFVFSSQGAQARYVFSGMETALFTFLITLSIFLLFFNRSSFLAGISFSLAAMTRPEGVMYFAVTIIILTLLSFSSFYKENINRGFIFSAVSFIFVYGLYFLWRYSYFGYLLPNTYYVKAAGFQLGRLVRGWEVLLEVLSDWNIYFLLVFATISLLSWKRHWAWILFPFLVGVTIIYFIFVGGDFIVWFGPRFIMPILPLLLLMSSEGLHNLIKLRLFSASLSPLLATFIVILVVCISYFYSWPNSKALKLYFGPQMRAWAEIGQWIKTQTSSDISIATDAVGLIPFYSERYTYDMFGLTDVHIAHLESENMGLGTVAHEKFDPQYILDQQPDCIVSTWMDADGNAVSAGLMSVNHEFAQTYKLVAVSKSRHGAPDDGRWVIETNIYKPNLFEKGYVTGLFCR